MRMKELRCHKCSLYLGCIEKGKIKNGAVLLCKGCLEKQKLLEDLESHKKSTANYDMPDCIKDIFDKKK